MYWWPCPPGCNLVSLNTVLVWMVRVYVFGTSNKIIAQGMHPRTELALWLRSSEPVEDHPFILFPYHHDGGIQLIGRSIFPDIVAAADVHDVGLPCDSAALASTDQGGGKASYSIACAIDIRRHAAVI